MAGLVAVRSTAVRSTSRRHDGPQRRDLGVNFRLVGRQRRSRCILRGRLGEARQHIDTL
jgi:hypothetical protein